MSLLFDKVSEKGVLDSPSNLLADLSVEVSVPKIGLRARACFSPMTTSNDQPFYLQSGSDAFLWFELIMLCQND